MKRISKVSPMLSRSAEKLGTPTIPEVWNRFVPEYKSVNYGQQIIRLQWDPRYSDQILKISAKRSANRIIGYIDSEELSRVSLKLESKGEASVRFGAKKTGHGYNGERGDFCLVGGVIRGRELSLFYRSLEMIGGFSYDLTLIDWLIEMLNLRIQTVTVYTTKAFVFALKGNSNEKLFPKLQGIFCE